MEPTAADVQETCQDCGGPLSSGPFGPRCLRCILSLLSPAAGADDPGVADLFPELQMEEQIARGGFGTVFRAEHRRMQRPVALKFLDTLLARSAEALTLFKREMVTVGALDHPGIVRAHDAGEREGHWYILMEFVKGEDCGALVRKHGTLPVGEACEIIRQAALALHYAHGKGLVHRDVKPGNLMLSQGADPSSVPTVKVLDFGLAGIAVQPLLDNPAAAEGEATGDHFLGTLEYVAPEQIKTPNSVDARADIYSLGATLRRFLTGKPAREGVSEQSLLLRMEAITSTAVPPIAALRGDLPPPFAALCDRLVALDREQRPATAADVAARLTPWCAGAELSRLFTDGPLAEKPFVFPKKDRRPLWLAAAGIVAIAATLLHQKYSAAPKQPAWKPVHSADFARERRVPEDSVPRLFSPDWEHDSQFTGTSFKECARFLPDGRVVFIDSGNVCALQLHTQDRQQDAVKITHTGYPEYLGVAPSGHFVWALQQEMTGLHIGRARPDGSPMPPLRYNFTPELPISAAVYEFGRKLMIKQGTKVSDGVPWGFAFVTADNLPSDTGLKEGDVLVADGGHRDIIDNVVKTQPGLWRFRLDDDAPVRRLATLVAPESCPVDVAVTRQGVFVLNLINQHFITEDDPLQLTHRLLRWDQAGWHECRIDQPIANAGGLAADPLSHDLYVVQGAANVTLESNHQRILRLIPSGPDRYHVEVFADRFNKLSYGGVAFRADGKRMLITDKGNRAVAVLRRRA